MTKNTFETWEQEQMRDPEFRAAIEAAEPEYQAARIAQMLGIPEVRALVDIARKLDESLQKQYRGYHGLSFDLLAYAKALHNALAPFKEAT
jgi:hypothetical protein